jgi:hypothetical protein
MGALPSDCEKVEWAEARKRRARHQYSARDGGHAPLCPPYTLTVGLDAFLDLLDENDHPPIFDPSRRSYV